MSTPTLSCMLKTLSRFSYSSLIVKFKWPTTQIRSRPYASSDSRHTFWRILPSHFLLLLYFPDGLSYYKLVLIFYSLQSASTQPPALLIISAVKPASTMGSSVSQEHSIQLQLPPTHLTILTQFSDQRLLLHH